MVDGSQSKTSAAQTTTPGILTAAATGTTNASWSTSEEITTDHDVVIVDHHHSPRPRIGRWSEVPSEEDTSSTTTPPLRNTGAQPAAHNPADQHQQHFPTKGMAVRLSRHVSRNPYSYGGVSFLVSLGCSLYGIQFAGFSITADRKGWWSRGTLVAKQQTQNMILTRNQDRLQNYHHEGDDDSNELVWKELTSIVQPGIDNFVDNNDDDDRRRILQERPLLFQYGPVGCDDLSWYTQGDFFWQDQNLWPIWRTTNQEISALSPAVIRDICQAEQTTKRILEQQGFCGGCRDDQTKCLPPLSLVSMTRLAVFDYRHTLSCDQLAEALEPIQRNLTQQLVTCVTDIRQALVAAISTQEIPPSCPLGFSPFMVDEQFGLNGNTIVRSTSSVFSTGLSTQRYIGQLYEYVSQLDTASTSKVVSGFYDTRVEHFYVMAVEEAIQQDLILAIIAIVVTVIAMIVHTKSPWITLAGLVQILVSFPVAYFVYTIILQFQFFPFLNFLGVYVVFAIGADDVFVACDKWKNTRLEHPKATTEEIASLALPDSAVAMFLTSSTTSIAFFGTAVCPIAALKLFSIFNGLLVFLAYILCILFVFPALCLYDRWKQKAGDNNNNPSRLVECWCATKQSDVTSTAHADEERLSLIRRIFSVYYDLLHYWRYPLLIFFAATFVASTIFASRLTLASTTGVRLLSPDSDLELAFQWRLELLGNELLRNIGSLVHVVWGLTPSDTGDHNNPDESSVLVLDESFDPTPEQNQLHLMNFCGAFFSNDFVHRDFDTYECPMNLFDMWLKEQTDVVNTTFDEFTEHCGNSTNVPVEPSVFHSCFTHFKETSGTSGNWSIRNSLDGVLSRSGIVRTMRIPFKQSGVRGDVAYAAHTDAWNKLHRVMTEQNELAPRGVDHAFAASFELWWYDTTGSLLSTAISGVFVALGGACAVLLASTRSLVITMFGVFTITYILVVVTALLVASNWTMGFLEAVCFAILIGISCDFVLHFGHAYSSHPGSIRREERTKMALVLMGPSILAAALTTIAAAIVMRFTKIVFFRKFATILLYSIVIGLFGAMSVLLVLTDVLGPAEPTAWADFVAGALFGMKKTIVEVEASSKQMNDPSPAETYKGKFIGHDESFA